MRNASFYMNLIRTNYIRERELHFPNIKMDGYSRTNHIRGTKEQMDYIRGTKSIFYIKKAIEKV